MSKEQLQELLTAIKSILKAKGKEREELAEQLLPTREGFFFGGTDYDSYYFDDLKDTKKIIEDVLEETDWDNEEIIYQASW